MAAVTIHDLPDETHRALERRAAQNERSTEAEIRAILLAAVRPKGGAGLGTALSDVSRDMGLTNADIEAIEHVRDRCPAEPMRFE